MRSFTFILLAVILSGCASPLLYNYESYSKHQYRMHKLQTDEAVAEYEAELIKVMESSAKHNKRVPPGIYAEYAYIHGRRGDLETAREYFHKELDLYPESEKYITFILDQLDREIQGFNQ